MAEAIGAPRIVGPGMKASIYLAFGCRDSMASGLRPKPGQMRKTPKSARKVTQPPVITHNRSRASGCVVSSRQTARAPTVEVPSMTLRR